MAPAQPAPRIPGILIAASAFALLLKLCLAFFTYGTNDVRTWEAFAKKYETSGTAALYRDGVEVPLPTPHGEPMNHPPLALTLLRTWDGMEHITGIPLRFWLRLTASMADVVCLLFLWKLFGETRFVVSLSLFAMAPAAIVLSGYHGNTDTIVAAAVVAAVYFASNGARDRAAILLALGGCIKIWPIVLTPVFLLFLPAWRDRLRFAGIACAASLLFSIPYIAEAPAAILQGVFSYRGAGGVWGLSTIVPQYANIAMPVLLSGILLMTWRLHRARAPLAVSCGGVMAVFLALAPGFGVQYLAWLLPWIVALGSAPAAVFYGLSGAFLFAVYTDTAGGLPWYFSDFVGRNSLSLHTAVLKIVCWSMVMVTAKMFYDGHWRPQQERPGLTRKRAGGQG